MAGSALQVAHSSQMGLGGRVLALAVLFAVEAAVLTFFLDGMAPFPRHAWLTLIVHRYGATVARCGIAFAGLFATFAYLRYGTELEQLSKAAATTRLRGRFFAWHVLAIGAFVLLSTVVYRGDVSVAASNLASAGWLIAWPAAIATASLAVLPWSHWLELRRATGQLWGYTACAAIAAGTAFPMLQQLWRPASRLTFWLVQVIAQPFFGDMVVDQEQLKIGTHRFTVLIADQCSGLEGIGLMLVFSVVWLILFRDEIRFPRALLLLPAGIVLLFFLNSIRILGLIAIGSAGAKDIAKGGFHSQAGWLAFNSVAFGLCIMARRLPWIALPQEKSATNSAAHADSTTALLAPFLAILGAGMISRAVSGTFEWFYALRFLAALGVLIWFRRTYVRMQWKPGWAALGSGVLVFALWVGLDKIAGGGEAAGMPAALATASPWTRVVWIALRFLGAILTVPIAEELAFRGYLMRRLISADFEAVSPKAFSWTAFLGSSLLFGFMHGGRWLAGTAAGAVYGLALLRRGRIGDAAAAHAVTNAMLAVYVLALGQWQYW